MPRIGSIPMMGTMFSLQLSEMMEGIIYLVPGGLMNWVFMGFIGSVLLLTDGKPLMTSDGNQIM